MRIGVDGGSWTNRRGYGRFLQEIASALAKQNSGHEFVMFLDSAAAQEFPPLAGFSVREVQLSRQIGEAARHDGNRSPLDLLRMSRAAARERCDVFFFPTVYSYFPLWKRVPVVVGIHDTIADRNPQFAFSGARQRLLWRIKVRAAIFQATLVMTVSEYSRKCLTEYLGVQRDQIRVVPEAAAARFVPPAGDAPREPFLLYVGGISPNKNLGVLIKAFARLDTSWSLKLAGDYESDGFRSCYVEIRELAESLGVASRVEFLGFVPDEDLADLYQRAMLFVLPSFDEGFGLPAIEAMASGTPVIVSEGNSLTEVVGFAGLSFAPNDDQALASAMQRVLSDGDLWLRLSREGMDRAAAFSWPNAAVALLHVLEEAARLP